MKEAKHAVLNPKTTLFQDTFAIIMEAQQN